MAKSKRRAHVAATEAQNTAPSQTEESTRTEQPQTQRSETATRTQNSQSSNQDKGFFLNAADWLLSRLPWFRDRYDYWGHGTRIFVGFLMYLIVLPVIPIVIGVIMYVRDPEGFRSSKAFPILGVIIAAWLGAFGIIAAQPSKQNNVNNSTSGTSITNSAGTASTSKTTKDSSDNATANSASSAKKGVQNRDKSQPTMGRDFKNCDAAFTAGVFNIPKSDSSYADHLDGDNDGVACEK